MPHGGKMINAGLSEKQVEPRNYSCQRRWEFSGIALISTCGPDFLLENSYFLTTEDMVI